MRYYREHPDEPINHDWLEGGKRETEELRAKLADSFYAKSEPIGIEAALAALSERNAPMPPICYGNDPAPSDDEEEQGDPEYNRDAWRRPDLT